MRTSLVLPMVFMILLQYAGLGLSFPYTDGTPDSESDSSPDEWGESYDDQGEFDEDDDDYDRPDYDGDFRDDHFSDYDDGFDDFPGRFSDHEGGRRTMLPLHSLRKLCAMYSDFNDEDDPIPEDMMPMPEMMRPMPERMRPMAERMPMSEIDEGEMHETLMQECATWRKVAKRLSRLVHSDPMLRRRLRIRI